MSLGEAFPDDAIADFSIQTELDVREMGLANHGAVDLGMQIWSKGLVAGISFAAQPYAVGVWLAGETVEVAVDAGLVTICHRGVVVATHAQRHRPDKQAKALRRKPRAPRSARPRQPTVGQVVTRKVDSAGCVSFAGVSYRAGRAHRGRQAQVAIVDATVEITAGGEVLRVHAVKHDRSREHGAFANAGGRPSRINAA